MTKTGKFIKIFFLLQLSVTGDVLFLDIVASLNLVSLSAATIAINSIKDGPLGKLITAKIHVAAPRLGANPINQN